MLKQDENVSIQPGLAHLLTQAGISELMLYHFQNASCIHLL